MFIRRMAAVAATAIGLALTAGFLGFIHSAAAFEMLVFATTGAA